MNLKRKGSNFQQSERQKEPNGCLWYKWKYAGVIQMKICRCIISKTKTPVDKQVYFENKDKNWKIIKGHTIVNWKIFKNQSKFPIV